ncbi:MAG: hypothetical protein HY520_01410 [Candidatus Aenigmarchaeota archaeon]|nr:hypothetical protein [Candidatus Aenigmarchaeota archaeon]
MDKNTAVHPVAILRKIEAVQVLYYLEDHNPHVTLDRMTADLHLDGSLLADIITKLLAYEFIEFSKERQEYSLTVYGRNMVKTLHEISIN